MPGDAPLLSVVIPVRDERPNVASLAGEIDEAFAACTFVWEVIWVDDGSTDGSVEELARLRPPHRHLRLEPRGQSGALLAGFREAGGGWVGTLDGDGQNNPSDLLRQLDLARQERFDMVNGVRTPRRDGSLRRIAARVANRIRNRLTGDGISDAGCSTRIMRRDALVGLPVFDGMHRFLPTLVRMRGFRVTEIPVDHRFRVGGRSKYGILDRLRPGVADLLRVRRLIARERARSRGRAPVPVAASADCAPGRGASGISIR